MGFRVRQDYDWTIGSSRTGIEIEKDGWESQDLDIETFREDSHHLAFDVNVVSYISPQRRISSLNTVVGAPSLSCSLERLAML